MHLIHVIIRNLNIYDLYYVDSSASQLSDFAKSSVLTTPIRILNGVLQSQRCVSHGLAAVGSCLSVPHVLVAVAELLSAY